MMHIPADPIPMFKNRTLFIMGAGRSGTTILFMLIGSMRPVFVSFEPVLLRLMPYLLREPNPELEQALLTTLFEDYFMPRLHGRRIDPSPNDLTYFGNYEFVEDLIWRAKAFNARVDSLSWVLVEQPLWLIKLPEFQPFAQIAARIFPNPHFIHIIRNGLHVVASAVAHSWYTDEWLELFAVEWVAENKTPWYMPEEVQQQWPDWNPETRAACAWRITTEMGMQFCENNTWSLQLCYEDFCQEPEQWANRLSLMYNVRQTSITKGHIQGIIKWKPAEYDPVADKIAEPERSKFVVLMKKLKYEER